MCDGVTSSGEEGQDAGGLLREWYLIISREIFNPNYALFLTSPGDRVTYTINPASHCNSNHLSYFKFVGRIIAKAIYDNKLLECYFTRSFYKHVLGLAVRWGSSALCFSLGTVESVSFCLPCSCFFLKGGTGRLTWEMGWGKSLTALAKCV